MAKNDGGKDRILEAIADDAAPEEKVWRPVDDDQISICSSVYYDAEEGSEVRKEPRSPRKVPVLFTNYIQCGRKDPQQENINFSQRSAANPPLDDGATHANSGVLGLVFMR